MKRVPHLPSVAPNEPPTQTSNDCSNVDQRPWRLHTATWPMGVPSATWTEIQLLLPEPVAAKVARSPSYAKDGPRAVVEK